jgi:hypothetical protein
MGTLVISDLHLGGGSGVDVLQDPRRREALTDALEGVERLVLLGDTLELRHGPVREALAGARAVLEDLGRRVEEVVLVPGNHDHALVAGWLERRAREAPPVLGLEQRIPPGEASWAAGRMAEWLGARTSVAYPGLWLRDDVYATHGHYVDLHSTIPTFERIAAGLTTRLTGELPNPATVTDYEARLAPVYAWVDAVAEWAPDGRAAGGAGSAQRAYRALTGDRGGVRARLLAGAFPVGIAAVNRAGLGPVSADLSGPGLRRATLRAMHEVTARLGIRAPHVIFGHSHRTGPLPGDDGLEWGGLVNCGSWVQETHFMREPDSTSPYWPGGAVRVDADGPPRLERLLTDAC